MSRVFHFNIDQMSLFELYSFENALATIGEVASGLQEQPRFSGESGSKPYNDAGGYLEDVRVAIGWEVDAIHEHARGRVPANDEEADYMFRLCGKRLVDDDANEDTFAEIAALARDVKQRAKP
jgi:hypothetical protein